MRPHQSPCGMHSKREEKINQLENELKQLHEVRQTKRVRTVRCQPEAVDPDDNPDPDDTQNDNDNDNDDDSTDTEFEVALTQRGFKSEEQLERQILLVNYNLAKARGENPPPLSAPAPPKYDLIEVPDSQLTATQMKEKAKQVMQKRFADGREKARVDREKQRLKQEEKQKADDELREKDPVGWLDKLRRDHQDVTRRINDRQQRHAPSRGGPTGKRSKKLIVSAINTGMEGEDNFGADDADWNIYLNENDLSEDVDKDDEERLRLEELLVQYDDSFSRHAMPALVPPPDDPFISLGTERIRAVEVLFRPYLLGLDFAGVGEAVDAVLRRFDSHTRTLLVKNIVLSGGGGCVPRLAVRLENEVRAVMPTNTSINVQVAASPLLDAWHGLSSLADLVLRGESSDVALVTAAQYHEMGPHYLAHHNLSNHFMSPP
eukprot:c12729_g1_i3.p1 GENE.c12729_g1_i3~~c12729_g1_i3.p1  ORF type:complete len:433 (-),score=140.11 c12729_g1_i3:95-1393(-)